MLDAPEASDAAVVTEFPEDGLDLPAHLNAIERDLISRALQRTNNNRNKAADLLRIKRTTLVAKLRRRRGVAADAEEEQEATE